MGYKNKYTKISFKFLFYREVLLIFTVSKQKLNRNKIKTLQKPNIIKMKFRNTTTAQKNLAALLKAAAKESIKGDAKVIADLIAKTEVTVLAYMKGEVRDLSTGTVILTELRRVIENREYEVNKLAEVA